MKVDSVEISVDARANKLRALLNDDGGRLGLITSIDGQQLVTLVLNTTAGTASAWTSRVDGDTYHSLSTVIPQSHWYERTVWDLFGLKPKSHPRLKHNLLHEPYSASVIPLRTGAIAPGGDNHRQYHHLEVKGDGVYEIPVGPIHAGIIEPGHFRFSCLGEIILNLEIRLGYVHRGIEKRLTEVSWRKARFIAESAASDSGAAYALAHAVAIESIFGVEPSLRADYLRSLTLEIERVAMHIADLGGIAGDIGFLAIASSMARLRGDALALGELLTGSRFQRFFVCPGGVVHDPSPKSLLQIRTRAIKLRKDLVSVIDMFLSNQVACDRMQRVGRVSNKLAADFGLVGVAGRASGIKYDARMHFHHGAYLELNPKVAWTEQGDVFARVRVRIDELARSLELIDEILERLPSGSSLLDFPDRLPSNQIGVGIVEAHRGELIHLVFTNAEGHVSRYAIKDPSVNNWTALAIAVRNNLVADFPLCNKSFSLSYSGHDL
ncbi:MAG: NADH-quinone oxidoreductase subunit C [Candidatus Obscuribacterales bacterium]|nr:NADH-quinone oxidoreductase subunit C [Candidatus Obscuribacterales bacterium]